MAGPTTEVLSEDLKSLKDDVHQIALAMSGLRTEMKDQAHQLAASVAAARIEMKVEVQQLAVSVAELRAEVRTISAIGKWAWSFATGTALASLFSGIWWAGNINSDMRHLNSRIDELRSTVEKMDDRARVSPLAPPSGTKKAIREEVEKSGIPSPTPDPAR